MKTSGRYRQTLERLSLTQNTYVVFTSDNGGSDRDTPPLRGGKGQLYEGGFAFPWRSPVQPSIPERQTMLR